MANLAIGDILKVRFGHTVGSQECFNVWHFWVDDVGAGFADTDAAGRMSSAWGDVVKPCMSTANVYDGCGLQINRLGFEFAEVFSVENTGNGSVSSDPLPGQVAAVIKLTTGAAGRSQRGRKYIAGAGETDNTSAQVPSPGLLANLSLLGAAFVPQIVIASGAVSATLKPCLDKLPTGTPRLVTNFTVRGRWGSQRRRSSINRPDGPFPPV